MIRYKINVWDALNRKGFNSYTAKQSKYLSQDTVKRIKTEDANINLQTVNRICALLDMQPKDIIEFVMTDEDRELVQNVTGKK